MRAISCAVSTGNVCSRRGNADAAESLPSVLLSVAGSTPIFSHAIQIKGNLPGCGWPIPGHPANDQGFLLRSQPGYLPRSEEHTSALQSQSNLGCRLLLEKKKKVRLFARPSKERQTPVSRWSVRAPR